MSCTTNETIHFVFDSIFRYLVALVFLLFIPNAYSNEIKPIPITPEEITEQEQVPSPKTFLWGNDVTISNGSVVGGISSDCDTFGNIYAARCTSYESTSRNAVRIYKSSDKGETWQVFWGFHYGGDVNINKPEVLVGQFTNNDWLYILYLVDLANGDIGIARVKLDTLSVYGFYSVVGGPDTISYYSACKRWNTARHLFVAYQKEQMGDATPDLHVIKSTDYGATWSGDQLLDEDGAHPDIAYGKDGYVFLAVKRSSPQSDIRVWRSTNQGADWTDQGLVTSDVASEDYPSIAAIHANPPSSATVWVTYDYYRPTKEPSLISSDLRYAYSTDAGVNWSTNHVLVGEADPNEMASDLNSFVDSLNHNMEVCYLKVTDLGLGLTANEIYYSWVTTSDPVDWHKPLLISDHLSAWDLDGENVCRVTYGKDNNSVGIVYAGRESGLFGLNFQDFYFDGTSFTDTKEEISGEGRLPDFSLSHNFPNPFNPETKIQYSLCSRQRKEGDGSPFVVRGPIHTTLKIYNILGQLVKTLVDEPKEAGTYEVTWDGKDENGYQVTSGVYFYKLQAEDFIQTKKMVLIK
jgi:hypothetical protein